mmetsp:Transcript_99/g.219  ORF Transcript_99/g.219 Transcript_99/m.219 type:complete len:290 (+) Transcript_99:135-1004(+)
MKSKAMRQNASKPAKAVVSCRFLEHRAAATEANTSRKQGLRVRSEAHLRRMVLSSTKVKEKPRKHISREVATARVRPPSLAGVVSPMSMPSTQESTHTAMMTPQGMTIFGRGAAAAAVGALEEEIIPVEVRSKRVFRVLAFRASTSPRKRAQDRHFRSLVVPAVVLIDEALTMLFRLEGLVSALLMLSTGRVLALIRFIGWKEMTAVAFASRSPSCCSVSSPLIFFFIVIVMVLIVLAPAPASRFNPNSGSGLGSAAVELSPPMLMLLMLLLLLLLRAALSGSELELLA